jgi:hypothetical protein
MNKQIAFKGLSRGLKRAGAGILAAGLMVFASACSDVLDIVDPDVVVPENLSGAQGADLFYGGGVGDFASAFSANNGGIVPNIGLFTDEFYLSGTFPTRYEIDRREVNKLNGTLGSVFGRLHRARQSTLIAANELTTIDSTDPRISEMWALHGYLHVFVGENYCNGAPLSPIGESGDPEPGDPLSNAEWFQAAITEFDKGASAAQDNDGRYLNAIGKARALMDLNQYSAAADAVTSVPTTWAYYSNMSDNSGRQENSVFDLTNQGRWSVANNEGQNGLPFRDGDPRTPYSEGTFGNGDLCIPFDSTEPTQFCQDKYKQFGSNVRLASGYEARLIEAEANIGNPSTFMDKLNELRSLNGMDDLEDPGSAEGRRDLLFHERARWFFGEGHRLSDMRRLVRQYGMSANDVFPTGEYRKGGPYGTDVNWIVPQEEENNPNFTQCTDRSA